MLLKMMTFKPNCTEEEYRAHKKSMLGFGVFLSLAGLATVAFAALGVPRLIPGSEHLDFYRGLYSGFGSCLAVLGMVVFFLNRHALRDPAYFKKCFVKDTDERNCEINSRSVRAAGIVLMTLSYIVMLVAGLFYWELFWFCYAFAILGVLLIVLFGFYYSRTL